MPGSGFFCPGPSYCTGAGCFVAVRFCSRAWSWSWSVVWFAKHTFTERIRYDTDNIYVSNEAYIKLQTMDTEAMEREYIRRDARKMVLATIDELNQYLSGNVTLEAATDAARELTHKLNSFW